MGVRGLGKLLKQLPGRKTYTTLDQVLSANPFIRVVAVDANLYAYKYATSLGDIITGFLYQSTIVLLIKNLGKQRMIIFGKCWLKFYLGVYNLLG